jgi:DNA-binding IclR family transcriptional regulator
MRDLQQAVGDVGMDMADMVILLEVAQDEILGSSGMLPPLSLRLVMPRQTVVRKLAVLEKRGYVMKEKRGRRRPYLRRGQLPRRDRDDQLGREIRPFLARWWNTTGTVYVMKST